LYATAVMGVTGARDATSSDAPVLVERIRTVSDLAVGVGLGISDGAQAAEVAQYADAVIVGSALVRALTDGGVDAVRELARELRAGTER
jgi:tryptophan synthase alpha chain